MTFVAILLYVTSIILTAGGFAILFDGEVPSHGFSAVMWSFLMVPELFWMIPHYADAEDSNDLRTPGLFRLGSSPPNTLFILAGILGFLHASVTFLLFRTFTTTFAWKLPNVACGAIVFLLLIAFGAILGTAAAVANRIADADALVEPRARRRPKR